MISQTFKAQRKPWWPLLSFVPVTYTESNPTHPTHETSYNIMAENRAKRLGITAEEWKRRDSIIKQMYNTNVWRPGDTFWVPKDRWEKYGERCMITHVVCSYIDMENDVWPKNDNPFMITARTLDKNAQETTFLCTYNYPSKVKPQ